jgi:hypothetical protein
VKSIEGRTEERFRSLEQGVRRTTSIVEILSYRVTVTEQTTTATAIKELQNLVSQQAGEIKVVREILQRIEAWQRGGIQRQQSPQVLRGCNFAKEKAR